MAPPSHSMRSCTDKHASALLRMALMASYLEILARMLGGLADAYQVLTCYC